MRLYVEEGLSTAEVAKRLDMSPSWVSTLRKERGIPVRPPGKQLNAERIIRRYVDEGHTIADIAADERVDSTRVRRLLVNHGVRIVPIGERLTKIDIDEVRHLYVTERLSIPAVAARLGVAHSTVQQAMKRHGIPTRSTTPLIVSEPELEAHLKAGLSNGEIAIKYGVTTFRITKRIRDLGLRRPDAAPQHEPPPQVELKRRYLVDKQPITALAERYGTTHSTVRDWLQRAGVAIGEDRPGTANRREHDIATEELHRLYVTQQQTAADIASQIGVTKKVALLMLHSNGIPVRPPGAMRPGTQMPLLDRLYQDSTICNTLKRHDVPLSPSYGPLRDRFPEPPEMTADLLDELYHKCGLSTMMMSLLIGYTEATIRRKLRDVAIPSRNGARSPWMQDQSI